MTDYLVPWLLNALLIIIFKLVISTLDDQTVKELIPKPDVINRELFIADHEATDTYPISCLRYG